MADSPKFKKIFLFALLIIIAGIIVAGSKISALSILQDSKEPEAPKIISTQASAETTPAPQTVASSNPEASGFITIPLSLYKQLNNPTPTATPQSIMGKK